MNNHYLVKLINGDYCMLCYKFRKNEKEFEKEPCEQDREMWNDEEYRNLEKIRYK